MFVASIDPGQTTGLVIARMRIDTHNVWLRRETLRSLTKPLDVLTAINVAKSNYIVMERKASNGSPMGTDPHDRILYGLQRLDYSINNHFLFKQGCVHLISPGLWKPVIKTRPIDYELWGAKTQHEKDAIGLLHYFVFLNHVTKEIHHG